MRELVLSQTQVLPLDVHPQGRDAPKTYHGHAPPHVKRTTVRSLNLNHPTCSTPACQATNYHGYAPCH
jgi:hypothetical protein